MVIDIALDKDGYKDLQGVNRSLLNVTNMFKVNALEALSDNKVKVAQAIRKEILRKRRLDSVSHAEDGQEWFRDDRSGQ